MRATRAEQAHWQARLDKANLETDFQRERAEVAERRLADSRSDLAQADQLRAQLDDYRQALAREVALLDRIAAMGYALAREREDQRLSA